MSLSECMNGGGGPLWPSGYDARLLNVSSQVRFSARSPQKQVGPVAI